MEKLSLNVLREEFLRFFESKDHLRLKSFSLVPEDDPSILLVNAGMTPMKAYFTGAKQPPAKRIATCQKCIRTLDIERVGITTRHGTFFEMLGNFSFGDYFKKEAIEWSWEFLTDWLNIPKTSLYASVYFEDDEAYDIWKNIIGLDEDHIVKMGKEDNFWEHGTGPCGPSSEIYYDHGEEKGCGSPDCKVGCDCDRFVEVWNNVFTQFDKQEDGTYLPLENKNIDTGMGLERLACVMQGVDSLFEVDTIVEILNKVCSLTNTRYNQDKNKDISVRVITDHIRSAIMLISDGVIPSNEQRGYVLRRLLRRASRHGRLLGKDQAFLTELVDVVIDNAKGAYPELEENKDYIFKVVESEEAKFIMTLDSGMLLLNEYLDEAEEKKSNVLSGDLIFKLHDTYGFPFDLTKEIAEERGFVLDRKGFEKNMQAQKELARSAQKQSGDNAWQSEGEEYSRLPKTIFEGYDKNEVEAKIIGLTKKDDSIEIVTDRTVFYAEGGGQKADRGVISKEGSSVKIDECVNFDGIYIHKGKIIEGDFDLGDVVLCSIDKTKRMATKRNHTATHMLQYALINTLGTHVHQAGSYVDEERLRFDFTHFSAMTDEEIDKVQTIVNDMILKDLPVKKEIMTMEEAKKAGAIALFGEKYSETVRVVSIVPYSKELCGGTHIDSTGQTGVFKIVSEGGVASGVRRIEALTGHRAYEYYEEKDKLVNRVTKLLKTQNLRDRVNGLLDELRELKKENKDLKNKLTSTDVKDILSEYEELNGVKVIKAIIKDAGIPQLRELADKMKDRYEDAVAVFVSDSEKPALLIAASKGAVKKGVLANEIIKEAASLIGGSGGGRPDMAQAGGKDSKNVDEALDKAIQLVKEALKND